MVRSAVRGAVRVDLRESPVHGAGRLPLRHEQRRWELTCGGRPTVSPDLIPWGATHHVPRHVPGQ